MKNLIFLTILFFLQNCFITPAFSQKQLVNNLTLYKEQKSSYRYQLDNLLTGFKQPVSFSKADSITDSLADSTADSTQPETPEVSKSLWNTLFDLSFWSELSGPGPFVGLGVDYPVFILTKNFSLYAGISFSHSLDNTLKYYYTVIESIDTIRQIGGPTRIDTVYSDSCISCQDSKAVEILSLKFEAQYHLPRSKFDIYAGVGFNTFFGETFKSFSRLSGSFGAAWRALKYIQVGLMCNVFKRFQPNNFGAVNDSNTKSTVEFVPGAFIKVVLY